MEYDRNQQDYSSSSPAGDAKYFSFDQGKIVPGYMSGTNKAEVDCLLCHLSDGNVSGAGRAWLQSVGCGGTGGSIGPINDPTCNLACDATGACPKDSTYGLYGAGMFKPGTKYDPFNRNMAIRAQSLQYAASLGIGATVTNWGAPLGGGVDGNYRYITGITGVPSTILGQNINATPRSQNCSACHARDDNTSGTSHMLSTVRFGYGNVYVSMPAGTAIEKNAAVADANGKNKVGWIELGCKTGMGKRGQKIGEGPNDKWGMSMFNQMFGLGKKPNDPIVTETLTVNNPMFAAMGITSVSTKERIPDYDVHDKAGMQCATCHYAVGSKNLTGVATNEGGFIVSSNGTVTIPAATNLHGLNTAGGENSLPFGVSYPAETIYGMDHQFAQGDDLKDTYGKNNLDGTVSCEICHIERTHPKYFSAPNVPRTDVDPLKFPPVPAHAGFPAFHIDKIACTACHIPELYVAPFRLKSRDWSTGLFKKGNETNGAFKNTYDWEYDLVTGSHAPIKPIYQWSTKYEKKKITPVVASEMPIWVALDASAISNKGSDPGVPVDDTSSIKTCSYGSRIFAECTSDADCPGGICWSGLTTYAAPANSRDVMKASIALDTSGILRRPAGNLNAASLVPLFDGWPLIDGIGVDTAARIDAMSKAGAGDLLKIFHANFDVTHGIVPAEWALGGSKRGGCVSCHSSAQPYTFNAQGMPTGSNPYYNSNSVGFFEGVQHGIPAWAGVGKYDMMKNPFNLYVDWDCTAYCGMGVKGDSDFFDPAGNVISGATCTNGSPFATIDQCAGYMQQNFDATMGLPSGTAKLMGLNDGISALQGFTLRETVSATALGCNPFTGAASIAGMMGFQANVNNCMPANNPMFTAGKCAGATPTMPGGCDSNSFRYKGMCFMDSDCNGVTWSAAEYAVNPYGLLITRGEIRARHKLQFQQGKHLGFESVSADGVNQLWWPILTEQNPSNPNHKWGWDQAGAANVCGAGQNEPCCTNPMTQAPMSCGMCADAANGGAVVSQVSNSCTGMLLPPNVRTAVDGNQFLGYTLAYRNYLMSFMIVATQPECLKDVASFSCAPDSTNLLQANCDASSSVNASSYTWNFGDGAMATGVKVAHPYATGGTYNVTLTVTGACGPENTAVSQVTVNKPVVVASFSATPDTLVNLKFNFDAGLSQNAVSYTWDFGDGSTGTGVKPIHTYAAPGTYLVCLTVTDAGGKTNKICSSITAGMLKPVAVVNCTVGAPGTLTVSCDATGSLYVGGGYSWNFGDGTGTTTMDPSASTKSHTYTVAGKYLVTLTATGIVPPAKTNKAYTQVDVK